MQEIENNTLRQIDYMLLLHNRKHDLSIYLNLKMTFTIILNYLIEIVYQLIVLILLYYHRLLNIDPFQ